MSRHVHKHERNVNWIQWYDWVNTSSLSFIVLLGSFYVPYFVSLLIWLLSVYLCWLYNWHSCWPASQVHMLTVKLKLSLCLANATSRQCNGQRASGWRQCRYRPMQSSTPALEEDNWSGKRSCRFTPGVPESRCGHYGKDKNFVSLPRIESHSLGRSTGSPITISNYILQLTELFGTESNICHCVHKCASHTGLVEARWTVTAHAQKPDFVFRRNGRVHLNRRGRQFSRLLAADVCASAVVMLDTPCSEVVWRVLATGVHLSALCPLLIVPKGTTNTTTTTAVVMVGMLDTPCSEVVWRVLATGVHLSALCPLLIVQKGTTNTTTITTTWRFGNFICVPCRGNHLIRPRTSNYSPTLYNIRTAESNVKTPQTTSHQKQHDTCTSLTSSFHLSSISNFQICLLRSTQEEVIVPEQFENLKKTTNVLHVRSPCR